MEKKIEIIVQEFEGIAEVNKNDKILIEHSMKASRNAYSPYSGFSVGAAVQLENGKIIIGNNRENAAFPSGICAEKTAIACAGANFPESPIIALAISASNLKGFTSEPVSPCGSCRQFIAEEEDRTKTQIRIILYGKKKIQIVEGNKNLLPLHFNAMNLQS